MYSSFFKLEFTPFRDVTKPDFLWLSEASSVILQDLEKDLAANSGLFILEGELGTGKSTLATAIANKLSNNFIIADTVDPGTDTLDLFKHIAHAFDLPDTFRSRDEFYKLFQTYLETKKATGKGVLLILDEAQNLDTDKLISITSLTNNTVADADILRILLVARCELIDSMSESEKALLIGDHAKTYSVAPLTLAETSDYITRCLEYAGATHEIFSSEAIQAVHEYSKGILRQINTICDNALLSAFIRETDEITPQIIHQAAYKFGLASSLEIEKPDHEEPNQLPAADTVAIDPPESRSWQVLGGAFLALIILCGIFFYTNSSKLYEAADVTGNEKTTIALNDAVPAGKQVSTTSISEMSTISNSDNKPNDTLPAAEELVPNSLPHIAAQKRKVILSIAAKIGNTSSAKGENSRTTSIGNQSRRPQEIKVIQAIPIKKSDKASELPASSAPPLAKTLSVKEVSIGDFNETPHGYTESGGAIAAHENVAASPMLSSEINGYAPPQTQQWLIDTSSGIEENLSQNDHNGETLITAELQEQQEELVMESKPEKELSTITRDEAIANFVQTAANPEISGIEPHESRDSQIGTNTEMAGVVAQGPDHGNTTEDDTTVQSVNRQTGEEAIQTADGPEPETLKEQQAVDVSPATSSIKTGEKIVPDHSNTTVRPSTTIKEGAAAPDIQRQAQQENVASKVKTNALSVEASNNQGRDGPELAPPTDTLPEEHQTIANTEPTNVAESPQSVQESHQPSAVDETNADTTKDPPLHLESSATDATTTETNIPHQQITDEGTSLPMASADNKADSIGTAKPQHLEPPAASVAPEKITAPAEQNIAVEIRSTPPTEPSSTQPISPAQNDETETTEPSPAPQQEEIDPGAIIDWLLKTRGK